MSYAIKKKFNEVSPDLELNEKLNDVEKSFSSAVDEINSFGKNTKDAVTETLGNIQKNVGEYIEEGKEKVVHFEKQVESSVRRYPMRALFVAAGVGLAIGLLKRK